jgi:hypothetical protein
MNLIKKLILSLLIGLAFAFGFNSIFFHLLDRPVMDQSLLILFSTAATGFLAFTMLDSGDPVLDIFRGKAPSINRVTISSFLREHAAGILLALIFICVYMDIGLKLNSPAMNITDNYLDADNSSWMTRIAKPGGSGMEMRGPHPFAYFIFRPLGFILNLFTHAPALSAIFLNTFTGGLCVFLAWVLIRDQTENRSYAFLIAALLGLSTAHLFLGSVVETYVFSAASLIGFLLILQKRKESMVPLVVISLITFGITLTNFVQEFIGFVVSRPRIKDILRFSGITISMGVILSLIHAAWFPSSKLFFLTSSAQAEEQYSSAIFHDPSWRAVGRVILVIRTLLLYAVIAPRPYVFLQDVGDTFPRFNFFKVVPGTFSYSPYNGVGNVLVFAWAALLLTSGVFFLWKLIRTRKADLTFALVFCILFNFVLHLNYGYEPFLYSPDWAYALIFFVGLSLAPLAKSRIFQGGLLIFLAMLAYNQWLFIQFIFHTIAPFTGQSN